MSLAGRMDAANSSGVRRMRCRKCATIFGTRSRCHGSTTVVAQIGSSPTSDRTFSRVAPGRQAQHVVVEAVLLVPHAGVTDAG